jgi:hypothetical protein
MTKQKLSNLDNFKVYNSHGMIEFLSPVDILYLNIDNIVSINHCSCSFYKDSAIPKPFTKLNVPIKISLYGIKPSNLSKIKDKSEVIEFFTLLLKDLQFYDVTGIEYIEEENNKLVFIKMPLEKVTC